MSTLVDRLGGYRAALAVKAPVRVATTANITLSGFQTIDGITLAAGDENLRVLVKDQSTTSQNGIYVANSGTWTRAVDFDGPQDFATGTQVRVGGGTLGAGEWYVSSSDPHTIGTSAIAFTKEITSGVTSVNGDTGAVIVDAAMPYGTRTLIKAVDTTSYTAAFLTESGREGLFMWRSGDYSTQIAADTQEGIYLKADAIASTAGAWVRAYQGDWVATWFGAIGDNATSNTTAFNGIVALASSDYVTRVRVPQGDYIFATQLHVSKPILFIGDGVGEITTNASGNADQGTMFRWNGSDLATMIVFSKQTAANLAGGTITSEYLWGGGFEGISFVGGNLAGTAWANTGIWMSSTVRARVMGCKFQSFKLYGIICDGGNGVLSARNEFDIHVVHGTVTDTRPMNGLWFRRLNGSSGTPSTPGASTQNTIHRAFGLVYDGTLVKMGDTDNNTCYLVQGVVQSGGSGYALSFEAGADQDCRNCTVFYVNGSVFAGAGTYGNTIYQSDSEASSIIMPSPSTTNLHYRVRDYGTGANWRTHEYAMSKEIGISSHDMRPDMATAHAYNHYVTLGTMRHHFINFTDAGIGSVHITVPHDQTLEDGTLIAVRYRWVMGVATSGAVRARFACVVVGDGDSVATPVLNEGHVLTVNQAVNTFYTQQITLGSAVAFTAGDTIRIQIERDPANASDTASDNWWLAGIDLVYNATGPATLGVGGTYNIPVPQI